MIASIHPPLSAAWHRGRAGRRLTGRIVFGRIATRQLGPVGLGGHRADRERGSATIWAICALTLVSSAVAWALLWTAAESTRHSAERAADTAALTAARAALQRLSAQDGPAPCAAAAIAARRAGASLVSCACEPLDCSISVARNMPLLGSFAEGLPGSSRIDSVQAGSRAGPVGESGTDGSAARRDGVAGIGGGMT
ncbi:Rv3654c family TadE-like protein [Actinospica robiniae]|uniref:Rv3654c family TadE-like protein n=1 Tax=Actinospica robiniae TaxID=304901 RepID=UPI0009FFBBC3